MTKKEVQARVLQNGKPLTLSKFTWNSKSKVFSTTERHLLLDFFGIAGVTFTTGGGCTFKTDGDCTFTTGGHCTFTTVRHCTFTTDGDCTFKTGGHCTFKTYRHCTFKTGEYCTFKTGGHCTFTTDGHCTFTTDGYCTFTTGEYCTFKTGRDCTWIHNWGKTPYPLLSFPGTRYSIECAGPNLIRSGCIIKPLAWWLDNVRRCAEEYYYTSEQQKEYALYVRLLAMWMEGVGLKDERQGA